MAQDRQMVNVTFPDGSVVPYPADTRPEQLKRMVMTEWVKRGGDPQQAIQAARESGAPRIGPQEPSVAIRDDINTALNAAYPQIIRNRSRVDQPLTTADIGRDISLVSGLIPGGGVPATAARYGGVLLGGALQGADEGNPLKGAGLEGGLELAGDLGGKALPMAGALTAAVTGLASKRSEDMKEVGRSLLRQRNRGASLRNPQRALPPGAMRRTGDLIKEKGVDLQKLEETIPDSVPTINLRGSATGQEGRKFTSEDPEAFINSLDDREREMLMQHAAELAKDLPYFQGFSSANIRDIMRNYPDILMATMQHTFRDTMQLGRSLKTEGENVFKAARKHEFIPPDVQKNAQQTAAMGTNIMDTARSSISDPAQAAAHGALTSELSDLNTIKRFNDNAWGSGGVINPKGFGAAGVRGGLATALAYGLGIPTGEDPILGDYNPFGLAPYVGLLAPSNLFRLGSVAGRASQAAPTAFRMFDAGEDEKKEKERVRLRNPGGGR